MVQQQRKRILLNTLLWALIWGLGLEVFFDTSEAATPQATQWSESVPAAKVLSGYPRPTLERSNWLDLNGFWEYCIARRNQTNVPGFFTNRILVPFPIESSLSTVEHLLTEQERLWYRRTFKLPEFWRGQKILLHFEAADWEARVWVNGKEQGIHRGGYDRFTFDITDALTSDTDHELIVSVFDPTETGSQPRGKQTTRPELPFFRATSGIWQTIWLEPVPDTSVESLKLISDTDVGNLKVAAVVRGETKGIVVEVIASDGAKEIARGWGHPDEHILLLIPSARLWSPDDPFLYDLRVTLRRDGKTIDEVSSYFGMRKISISTNEGFPRLMLNNKRLFQLGPLDQGYWPDGLYTAPSDEALRYDIEVMKRLGFNMCRKHVKIEPERWYYWCDRLGLLVWQDMPNGDRAGSMQQKEIRRRPESAKQFETELKQMISGRGNHPCIVMWVAFNQAWGQYDTARIVNLIKELDPSRLVIGASGWYDLEIGDVRSLHSYPGPANPILRGGRPCVLGECGGLGLAIEGHVSVPMGRWNVTPCASVEELTTRYLSLLSSIQLLAEEKGLSGAVITQLTDIEGEQSGFLTYDRAIIKMPVDKVWEANRKVIQAEVRGRK